MNTSSGPKLMIAINVDNPEKDKVLSSALMLYDLNLNKIVKKIINPTGYYTFLVAFPVPGTPLVVFRDAKEI
jgi:hypothetical protein